ncbi:MAG: hypothetical protein GX112_09340 [Clostridiaceae bacterium]|jgi:hypothetical protein|nr:hypothetical protein [Clostridiaceae bacterium]
MQSDIECLRALASRYAEAAAHPRNQENARLYRAVNGLKMIRPVVLIDEQPWNELNTGGILDLRCQDPVFRAAEQYLRRRLLQWEHHPADLILPPFLPVFKIIGGEAGGIPVREEILATDADNTIVSHQYADQLAESEDIARIRMPRLTYEKTATEFRQAKLAEAVGDLLPVRIVGHSSYFSQWDLIATYRGVTSLLIDLAERPDHAHAIMDRVTRMLTERYRQYEELDLLDPEPFLIHCTAGLCDELKTAPGEPVLRQNIWGRCMAQIFASVSPAMHEEFDIDYQIRTMEPFGLVYYGCCEPLDRKIEIVRKIPRLRKISVTPWADIRVAAEAIGGDFVVSAKPNPAHVGAAFDPAAIKNELRGIIQACRSANCSFEIVLKDISSISHNPDHLRTWEHIAMDLVRS